ncbi:MAG: LPS export ABC transporter periplasmic protein LptC [Anaerolineae bacterium]|nr:LPS export ABC transporter periplasmic protein LptC [Gemmatimonadaceae bacterium]
MSARPLLVILSLLSVFAACTDRTAPVQVAKGALADSADQVLFRIKTVLTDRGLLRAELEADSAFFFDDNTRIELRKVNTTFFTSTGERSSVLTSREGTYNTRLQETEARGDVVVVSNEGNKLETSQLKYQQAQNEISSDSAFVFTEKGRRLEGIGFVSDPDMRNVRVKKITTGGGTFTLPGQ